MARALLTLLVLLAAAAPAGAQTIEPAPWRLTFSHPGGPPLIESGLGYRDATGWHRALRARSVQDGRAEVETENGEPVQITVARAGEGVFTLEIVAPGGAAATGARFEAVPGERFFGTGERSDAVDRAGRETESYVADGPYRAEDRQYVKASVPPWAERDRDDATYFPIPWMLSSRGWGVLIEEDATSRFTPHDDGWEVDADGSRLRLRIFAGPRPADALRRFTAFTGRQPPPQADWAYGPWFQTGQPNVIPPEEEAAITKAQRDAGAAVSVAETQMHHLPCGAHEGREGAERARNDFFHANRLARLVYFNPSLCVSYREVYDRAVAAGVLQKDPLGLPFAYPAFVGGAGPAGFTEEPLAQFDFTHPATEGFYEELVREAVALGADGWMEDFGEGSPPLVVQHDGSTGDAAHNRYPRDYHCTVQRIAARLGKPVVRFQRSGWTGAARCADVVWGGDPTTLWGFDGLSSAATQVLSIGLSGIARWGTDIGGYNSFGGGYQSVKPGATEDEKLTPELLVRWMELGAMVPVMRTKRSGIALPSYTRPQVYDPEQLPHWTRLTRLHHALNPYLRGADAEHRRTGLPIARHAVLMYPDAPAADDQWLLGRDLLAAPVLAPGLKERRAWLPPGRWIDWWERDRVHDGGERTLPAPLGFPPLLLRAGAVIPLLPEDSVTLYGHSPRGRRLLVVPRGRTLRRLADEISVRVVEGRRRVVVRVRGAAGRPLRVELVTSGLRHPFKPRRSVVNVARARRVTRIVFTA